MSSVVDRKLLRLADVVHGRQSSGRYETLEVLGPEHEFSLVDEQLKPLAIVDRVIKRLCGRVKNNAVLPEFVFGKELQKHVGEFKAIAPFRSPARFEETMHQGILELTGVLDRFGAQLLGTGMHPTLCLGNVEVWDHRDRAIYAVLDRIFNLVQHGWVNIQSFQLHLPYRNQAEAVRLYNHVATILPYIAAISASSPIYESTFGEFVDNRLYFYGINQAKIPSITGDIIPQPIDSFETYRNLTIRKYSADLQKANAPSSLLNKEWINSRGAVFRFDLRTIEIRIMDEQECIKSDVALSCFVRALLRGLTQRDEPPLSLPLLVHDLQSIIRDGLNASVRHPNSSTARGVCRHLLDLAYEYATTEERSYLPLIQKRVVGGNLSETIAQHVRTRLQKTDVKEAILTIYSKLAEKLIKNEVYT